MVASAGEHLVLYDGVCALCHGSVRFVLPRDRHHHFDFAPLQSATGRAWLSRMGKSPDDLDTFVVVLHYRGVAPTMLTKGRAALFVAGRLGFPWRLFTILRALPTAILNASYDLIARNRYRLFGRYDVCPLPPPEQRSRFVDGL
jgi:predicted DCC family thiol-disulfide oxidoreductase YuxK